MQFWTAEVCFSIAQASLRTPNELFPIMSNKTTISILARISVEDTILLRGKNGRGKKKRRLGGERAASPPGTAGLVLRRDTPRHGRVQPSFTANYSFYLSFPCALRTARIRLSKCRRTLRSFSSKKARTTQSRGTYFTQPSKQRRVHAT